MKINSRAEIIVKGLVQGVGFRYFVYRKATELNLTGYVKNQIDGSVLTVVEGEKSNIEVLFNTLKIGPMYADVRDIKIAWSSFSSEYSSSLINLLDSSSSKSFLAILIGSFLFLVLPPDKLLNIPCN